MHLMKAEIFKGIIMSPGVGASLVKKGRPFYEIIVQKSLLSNLSGSPADVEHAVCESRTSEGRNMSSGL